MMTTLKPKALIGIGAAVAVAVLAGLLATHTWNPSWNPFQAKPERTIEKGFEKLMQKDSLALGLNIKADINRGEQTTDQGAQAMPQNLVIEVSAVDKSDGSDPENPKHEAIFNVQVKTEGMQFSGAGEIRMIGKDLYFRLTELPALGVLMQELSQIKNQWYYISSKDIQSASRVKELENKEMKRLSKDVEALFAKTTLFTIKQEIGTEDVKEEKAIHYSVGLSKQGIKTFVPALLNLVEKYVPEAQKQDYSKEKQEFLTTFNEKFEEAWPDIKEMSFDVWIGKSTDSVRKIAWSRTIDLSQVQAKQVKEQVGQGMVDLTMEISFSDFNKKFDIKTPENFKPAQDLMDLFSGMGSEMTPTTTAPLD